MDPERQVIAALLAANAELVGDVLRGAEDADSASVVQAIVAARSLAIVVEDALRALVDRERKRGQTWAQIGDVLDVSRQAAFQRFGAAPVPGTSTEIRMLLDGSQRAVPIVEKFLSQRWDEMRAEFNSRMRERLSVELLEDVYGKTRAKLGAFQELGKPAVSVRAGCTVVEVPITFERGDRLGIVTVDGEKQVAGFAIVASDPIPPAGR